MPIWEGVLLQASQQGWFRACFYSGCEKFGMRRDTRSLCEKTNGDLKRPGYHYRHGHQDISDSDWTETSSDSNESDESSIVFFQLLSRRRVDNVVVTFCDHKWRQR